MNPFISSYEEILSGGKLNAGPYFTGGNLCGGGGGCVCVIQQHWDLKYQQRSYKPTEQNGLAYKYIANDSKC